MGDNMHSSSYNKMLWFRNIYLDVSDSLNILDIGSLDTTGKNYNYKSIFNIPNWNYTGLDYEDGDNVDMLVDDIYNIVEIEDNSYDVIISGQLFEHLEFFWITMKEIKRILKPNGYCCIIAPSGGPKHGVSTFDCYRFYEDGMASLARYVDFEVLHVSTNYNKESHPWNDTCLVAKKTLDRKSDSKLQNRIDNLESKLDKIINNINNI